MSLTFLRIDRSNTAYGYRSSGEIFPLYISRLIPPKVGKEGIRHEISLVGLRGAWAPPGNDRASEAVTPLQYGEIALPLYPRCLVRQISAVRF